MGKKKRGHPDIEEILARPWCYYCERDFDDQKVLINHQKAKHFKCERCGRRLNTAGGLSVHMTQVHKETLTSIENALPNRSNLDVEIFGMEGIPADVVNSHNQRVLSQFAQAEAERRAATGNPGPGGSQAGGVKKPKFESPADLKKRLAEHKAKVAADQVAGINSGDVTPGEVLGSQSPGFGQSPGYAGSPPYAQQQMPFSGAPSSNYSAFPQSYGPPNGAYQQPTPMPQQSPGFPVSAVPPFPNPQAYVPPQQYSPPVNPNFPPPQYQGGPPRAFGVGSPPTPYNQQGQYQPPRIQTPPQGGPLGQRTGSLPGAPGLPQRPSFGAPPVNAFQMQQLHQGQLPAPSNHAGFSNQPSNPHHSGTGFDAPQFGRAPNSFQQANGPNNSSLLDQSQNQPQTQSLTAPSTSLDDLISSAADNATKTIPKAEPSRETKTEEPPVDKKSKKDKDKNTKMVYSDNEISPEEKMAKLPRYAFAPDGKGETVLGDATTAAVTGVVDEQMS